jgi:hypothetical protein
MNFKKLLIWTLIFNFFQYLIPINYVYSYLNVQSNMLNEKFNLSTSYKSYIIIFIWLGFTFMFCPLLYYIYFNILNKSNLHLSLFIFFVWLLWDIYPLCMTDNGYKINNILMNLFDCIYSGLLWCFISLYFFNNYYKIIEKYNSIIIVLFLLNIFIMLLFFYTCFTYNRKYTENNWLVKLGDKLKWNEYLKYIILH